jgi:hypothetical protein
MSREIGRPPLPNSATGRGWENTKSNPSPSSPSLADYPSLSPKSSRLQNSRKKKSVVDTVIDPL